MAIYLVCEGFLQGLDRRVLQALVVEFHNLSVLIAPAGGSKGQKAVRVYLESHSSHNVAVAIEDRDYRPQTEADATWANQAARSFIWHRHEIENYLLLPRVVLDLFTEFRTVNAAWTNSLPANEADVSMLLQDLAGPLLEDHAAELLKAELVRQINGAGNVSFGPGRPVAPGAHLCGQAQWLPALQQEASRLCRTCAIVASLPDMQPGSITARYSAILAQLQNPSYLISGDYLVEMGGKQLLGSLSRYLHGLGAPGAFDRDRLANELLRVLEKIYQPNSLFHPDDFAELATILRRY